MAVTVLSFVSGTNVDFRWPDAHIASANSAVDADANYEVSSFGQDTAAVLVFEWGQDSPDQIAAILRAWTGYAAEAGLQPGPAPFGPQLGSQTPGGIEGFRYSVVGPGGSGGLGVKT
jgi:hypothetical protein